jgi:hypothetical protein
MRVGIPSKQIIMATVILSHRVKDYETWRPIFDADIQRRKDTGFYNERVFRGADDPGHIYVMAELNDPSALQTMMNDPDLAEKMGEAGVITKPEVLVLNPA